MKTYDTPEEIALKVRRYFGSQGITLTKAAEMLGVTLAAVTNQMNNRPFGKHNANIYAKVFGFDAHYLQTGNGTLFPKESVEATQDDGDIRIPRETLALYENMSESLRILSQLVERYAPREAASIIKGGIYPLDRLTK